MIKIPITLLLLSVLNSTYSQKANYINPSGYYELVSKTYEKGGDVYGYTGFVKVLLLKKNKILVSFYTTSGAPGYNSGSFVDSLEYKNNKAIYRGDGVIDSACVLTLIFKEKKISIKMETSNPNFACGFGHGVNAKGDYLKKRHKSLTKDDILDDIQQ